MQEKAYSQLLINCRGEKITVLIDVEDEKLVSQYSWYLKDGYIRTHVKTLEGKRTNILMHRLIMLPAKTEQVDHINGIRNDNRKANLRICSACNNAANRRKRIGKYTSGYKGVSSVCGWRWRARIMRDGTMYSLGMYRTAAEAAEAYNRKAIELFGDYAQLNIIQ